MHKAGIVAVGTHPDGLSQIVQAQGRRGEVARGRKGRIGWQITYRCLGSVMRRDEKLSNWNS